MSCDTTPTTINPREGYRYTIACRDPLTGAALTGLTGITGHLSSTAPGDGDADGTPIADTTVSLVATSVAGQYSGTISEVATVPGCAGLSRVWAIIDGPNIYEVQALRVVWT